MTVDQNMLSRIRNYGALKYTASRICDLLALSTSDRVIFLQEFEDPESDIRKFYEHGVAIGDYNQDVELAKQGEKGEILAIIELNRIQHDRKVEEVKKDLFGI